MDWSTALRSLSEQHGGIPNVPYDPLYEFLTTYKSELLSIRQADPQGFERSPLCKHVQSLCKTDLFWMARYFTWETNPAGAGQPIHENKVTAEEYKVVCDFFVHKDPAKSIPAQDSVKNRLLLWPRGGL